MDCLACDRVHPENAPHLGYDNRQVRFYWSGAWPYLAASVVSLKTLAAASVTMRDRQALALQRAWVETGSRRGPQPCRVLNAEGQLIALIDPVTRRRLPSDHPSTRPGTPDA